ncbi:hypothetical protein ACIHDR_38930 [Nocardia sp. NPDC052278]|uniref:hypothetical protein n=1 Tax=unclassified Nocardia TaxID=2637762 RepID=UPI00369391FE
MGGALASTAAGTYPDRIVALATFDTGRRITDDELSPSRVVPTFEARVLVVGADHDTGYLPEMAEELDRQLTEADADHMMEVYRKRCTAGRRPTSRSTTRPPRSATGPS